MREEIRREDFKREVGGVWNICGTNDEEVKNCIMVRTGK